MKKINNFTKFNENLENDNFSVNIKFDKEFVDGVKERLIELHTEGGGSFDKEVSNEITEDVIQQFIYDQIGQNQNQVGELFYNWFDQNKDDIEDLFY